MEEEAEFHLTCDIWANPMVSNVVWTLNDSSVDLEEVGLLFTNDGFKTKLSSWKAERGRHEGTYSCSVTYFSKKYSKIFNLKLTGQSKQRQFSEYVSERLSSPSSTCVAASIPPSVIFSTCR